MKTTNTMKITVHASRALALCMAIAALVGSANAQAILLHQWMLDNDTTGYNDTVGGADLSQNVSTSTAFQVPGSPVNTTSMELAYVDPGPATQIYSSAGQSGSSFGFSFWVNPVFLAPFNNFIGKETTATNRPDWASVAWQVHLLDDIGGFSNLEFVVRGDDTFSDFVGVVATTNTPFKIGGDQADVWINIAGGYDVGTGALSLFVNGLGYTAGGGAGASLDSTAPFFAGTGFNGAYVDPVTYSAGTRMWDLRFYDSPLTQSEVDGIIAAVPEPGTWALLAIGMGVLALVTRRRVAQTQGAHHQRGHMDRLAKVSEASSTCGLLR
ncbi:MAG: PEP-CTERM sorting domain-containing protein [Chthoniobacterales bacterium]|nr:PEP-CTERM sorting domain-containing protein [Chthoniobacterales bacterium]